MLLEGEIACDHTSLVLQKQGLTVMTEGAVNN